MCKEKWIRWKPKLNLTSFYFVCRRRFFGNSLEIFLSDPYEKEKDLKFLFDNSVLFYGVTEERCRLSTIGYLGQTYNGSLLAEWSFFKVFNSEALSYILSLSETEVDGKELTHFSIVDDDLILDVIASKEPEVSEVNLEEIANNSKR